MLCFDNQEFNIQFTENYVNELLKDVRESLQHDLPRFSGFLRNAFLRVDPVFTRPRYAEFFFQCASTVPGWMEQVVLLNSKGESEGSVGLLRLWEGITDNDEVADAVLTHAIDESRHSRMFVNLVRRTFPGFMSENQLVEFESELPDVRLMEQKKAPHPISERFLIDHLVQMNIGEIRTRLHMHLFAPILKYMAPAQHRRSVRNHLVALARDEMRHIGYTARLVESWAEDGNDELIENLYLGRLNTFNKITVTHTRYAVQSYGHGKYPELLEM